MICCFVDVLLWSLVTAWACCGLNNNYYNNYYNNNWVNWFEQLGQLV